MGKVEIEETDELPRPPALVCYQECEDIRLAALAGKKPKEEKSKKFADMSGRLKIVVVNPTPCKDCMEDFWSAVLSLGTMLIGIVVFAVLMFSVGDYMNDLEQRLDKLHVPLCTIGFLMFSGPGIMSINSVYGPSAQMKRKGRIIDHILIVVFGLIFAVVGGGLCFGYKTKIDWLGYHCLVGLVSYALAIISIATGIAAGVIKNRKVLIIFTVLHPTTGILAFLAYVGCFITGILFPVFKVWARDVISWYYWVLVTMVLLFTIIIILVPLVKCCINMKKCRKIRKFKCTKAQTKAYIIAEKQKEAYLKEIEEERIQEEKQREANALKYQKSLKPQYR